MSGVHLSNSQVLILKCLLRNPNGLTRDALNEKTGCVCDTDTLGPVYADDLHKHSESLYALGMVSPEKKEPGTPVVFTITEKGEQAATVFKGRETGAKVKVDPAALDTVILSLRGFRTYGFEEYTEDDLREVRSRLPEEFRTVTFPDLKRQIINRRKQGAFSKNRVEFPDWYTEYRQTPWFKGFANRVKDYYGGCAVCGEEEVGVYHRRTEDDDGDVFYRETPNVGIALCAQCFKRNGRFLCSIPQTEPV